MKGFVSKQPGVPLERLYATGADFCRVFENDMDHLYVLSLLLTGDQQLAEKCFVTGLETSRDSNAVFREWTQSWARRTIVSSAIRMIRPRPTESSALDNVGVDPEVGHSPELAAVLRLSAFDRFCYVLSVLEGYPLRECALLLNCTPGEVNTARMQALQEIVKSVERRATANSVYPRKTWQETSGLGGLLGSAAA